ncbi:uncharacterized protein LOC113328879 [Papaver somniferum]|uniref:uncharacterized protein LOC113328879 n=1 Tax=Papaver somniferum TaxID=3469 RepID=UPI000E6F9097|nr:uncharacterized protein LOC113328879 [Papaver somniferum]
MVEIWFSRNREMYEDQVPSSVQVKGRILNFTKECNIRLKGEWKGDLYDFQVLCTFGINNIPVKTNMVKECFFKFPELNQVLLCCEGATRGNPGQVGVGCVGRDSEGRCIGAFSGGIGIATTYIAEVMALVLAGEWAIKRGYINIFFSLNSRAVLSAFVSERIPWIVNVRWKIIKKKLRGIDFKDLYKETNFSATKMAKKGALMARGEWEHYDYKTIFLGEMETENTSYFRF